MLEVLTISTAILMLATLFLIRDVNRLKRRINGHLDRERQKERQARQPKQEANLLGRYIFELAPGKNPARAGCRK